jgi:hypothetical protein
MIFEPGKPLLMTRITLFEGTSEIQRMAIGYIPG